MSAIICYKYSLKQVAKTKMRLAPSLSSGSIQSYCDCNLPIIDIVGTQGDISSKHICDLNQAIHDKS